MTKKSEDLNVGGEVMDRITQGLHSERVLLTSLTKLLL